MFPPNQNLEHDFTSKVPCVHYFCLLFQLLEQELENILTFLCIIHSLI